MNTPNLVDVNMLSVIFHVLGFNKSSEPETPPDPAENARDADILMCNWIISNTTDEDVTLTFENRELYDLHLVRLDSDETIWTFEHPKMNDNGEVTEPFIVTVPRKGTFAIPKSEEVEEGEENGTGQDEKKNSDEPNDDEDDLEVPPTVPLKEIIDEFEIDHEIELAIRFTLRAKEFPQSMLFPLWR